MYRLAQIYEEDKYDLHDLLRLHEIVKGLGMEKQDIIAHILRMFQPSLKLTYSLYLCVQSCCISC